MPPRSSRDPSRPAHVEPQGRGHDLARPEDQWLDLIADIIAQDLLNEESTDADALRHIRQVQ